MAENPDSPVAFVDLAQLDAAQTALSPEEYRVLDTINQKIAANQSLEQVMDFLFEVSKDIFPCDRIGVSFLEDRSRRLVSRWVGARYSPVYLNIDYSESMVGSSLEEIFRSGHTRIISDIEKYSRLKPSSRSSRVLVREGVRSNMTCPLIVEGRQIGFLFRSSRDAHAYDDHQVMLHGKVAERLSQAVEKAYRIDHLAATNQAYIELLAFASHELKSPLASMIMDGQLLIKGHVGEIPKEQLELVQRMMNKAEALLAVTRDYLDLSRLEGDQFKVRIQKAVSFQEEVIAPVLETLRPQFEAKKMNIILDQSITSVVADCDPDLMKIVWVNLLGNAIKYGEEQGEIRVHLNRGKHVLKGSVWNSGTGFPEQKRNRLFRKFSRLDLPEFHNIKGSGVGLYIVWQIVDLHGGRMSAESEYGSWAEFSFEIPQPLRAEKE